MERRQRRHVTATFLGQAAAIGLKHSTKVKTPKIADKVSILTAVPEGVRNRI
jgi:hypothetical protein